MSKFSIKVSLFHEASKQQYLNTPLIVTNRFYGLTEGRQRGVGSVNQAAIRAGYECSAVALFNTLQIQIPSTVAGVPLVYPIWEWIATLS